MMHMMHMMRTKTKVADSADLRARDEVGDEFLLAIDGLLDDQRKLTL